MIPHMKAKLILLGKNKRFFFGKYQKPNTKNQKMSFPAPPISNLPFWNMQIQRDYPALKYRIQNMDKEITFIIGDLIENNPRKEF